MGQTGEEYPEYDEGSEEDEVDAFVKDEEIRDLEVTIDSLSDELESLEVRMVYCSKLWMNVKQ